jgi:hypothetical protein
MLPLRWTGLLSPKFTGLKPSPDVLTAFRHHNCEEHRRIDRVKSKPSI